MLEYDEEEGIIWVSPMLASKIVTRESDDIVVTIDDCDCDECEACRGPVPTDHSVYIKIPIDGGKAVMQRLSIEEAGIIGRALVSYSENLQNMLNLVIALEEEE